MSKHVNEITARIKREGPLGTIRLTCKECDTDLMSVKEPPEQKSEIAHLAVVIANHHKKRTDHSSVKLDLIPRLGNIRVTVEPTSEDE